MPAKLRREYDIFSSGPLTDIFNSCLSDQIFPSTWKMETVTPIPKTQFPEKFSELRKVSGTSDYSKLFESILKDFILKDVYQTLPLNQYGGRSGVGTEHLIITFTDRVLKMLDSTRERAAVIAAAVDWKAAFDRVDPAILIQKFIKIGIRPSIIPILISYLSDRKMKVKFNNKLSTSKSLVGGCPQGTMLGGFSYIVASCDNCDTNSENCDCPPDSQGCYSDNDGCEDTFSYYDDLNILELLILSENLNTYDVWSHVPSDIANDQLYIKPENFQMQGYLKDVSHWSDKNKMLLNESKSKYIIFSRSKSEFATRILLNDSPLEKLSVIKLLGVWFQQDLGWSHNTKQICKSAYSRMAILGKLKYVGVSIDDLLTVYKLFIRCVPEYCSTVFHSSLTQEQSYKIERLQANCLKFFWVKTM